jgi:glycerol-3-phosphate dehydrogenase
MPVVTRETRAAHIERLKSDVYEVLIVGGGINGVGLARDLAMRSRHGGVPLKVALVEKNHFSSGTSGRNSQLIHGGLRYLKYFDFRLVREALHERATLLRLAPHLVYPLPFLIPMYSSFARLYYGIGLKLYDVLSGERKLGRQRHLSARQVAELEPGLDVRGLAGGAIFFDCGVHSARFALENLWDAMQCGASAVNYVEAGKPWRDDEGLWRVPLTDRETGEAFVARTHKIVDAAGPWGGDGRLRLVRGSHIIIPRVNTVFNAIAYFDEQGRIVFLIPWGSRRDLTLVGTTDVDHEGSVDDVHIGAAETAYLRSIVQRLFPQADSTPLAAYSSLRPLVPDTSDSPTSTSREHRIWNDANGVLHIAGGKYTTYRVMSEEAADLVCAELAPQLASLHLTAREALQGNTAEALEGLKAQAAEMGRERGLDAGDAQALWRDYGVHMPRVLEYLPEGEPVRQGITRAETAQLRYAVEHEMACHLADAMFISTYLGYERHWTPELLTPFAQLMGELLGWDDSRQSAEIARVLEVVALPLSART